MVLNVGLNFFNRISLYIVVFLHVCVFFAQNSSPPYMMTTKRRRCCAAALDTLPEDLFCHIMSFCDRKMNGLTSLHLVSRSVRHAMRSVAMLSTLSFDLRHPVNVLQLGTLAADVQKVRFKSCSGLHTLQFTPKLRLLDVSYCNFLKSDNFNCVRSLSMLQTLNVSGSQLTNLDVLAGMKSIRHLYASNCNHLTSLPAMPDLQTLNIDCCLKLEDLTTLSEMTTLTWLSMSGRASAHKVLATLPDSLVCLSLTYCRSLVDVQLRPFKRLVNLTHLDLSGCQQLESLNNVACLTQLVELRASFCDALCNVKGLSGLTSLRKFSAPHSPLCTDGELNLSGLVALEELDVSSSSLVKLSFPHLLPNLHTLQASYCPLLQHLAGIDNAPRLRTVNLSDNPRLGDSCLTGFSKLLHLTDVCLRCCPRLTVLGVRKLPKTLHRLILHGCTQIDNLTMAMLASFSNLQRLDLQGCALISDEGLHDLSAVRTLQYLNLSQCNRITDAGLFGLSKLVHLRVLRLDSCRKITDLGLRALEPLTEIESLDLNRCKGVVHLKALSALVSLQFINLSGCVALTDDSLRNLLPCKKLATIYTNHCKHVSKSCVEIILHDILRPVV